MKSIRTRFRPSARRGFTLIELLVVISIIAVLASLIAPAVQSARRSARKLECLNNIRQVGIAMQSFSAALNGQLPNLMTDMPNSTGTGTVYGVSWAIQLLPALDQASLLKNLKQDTSVGGSAATPVMFSTQDLIWLPVFTCPDDSDSFRQTGGLSYVVNAGFISSDVWGLTETNATGTNLTSSTTIFHQPWLIDWNHNGSYSKDGVDLTGTAAALDSVDAAIATASGVFWRQTPSYQASLDRIGAGDGQSSTILITENLDAGPWNGSRDAFSGYGVNQLGFGIRIPVSSGQPSAALFASYGTTFNANLALQSTNSWTSTTAMPDDWKINRAATPGTSTPRPSSKHSGGVNVIFADGSGRFLNEAVDNFTYAKLITPDGVNFGETTLNQASY